MGLAVAILISHTYSSVLQPDRGRTYGHEHRRSRTLTEIEPLLRVSRDQYLEDGLSYA